jgi:hypothetical protein
VYAERLAAERDLFLTLNVEQMTTRACRKSPMRVDGSLR